MHSNASPNAPNTRHARYLRLTTGCPPFPGPGPGAAASAPAAAEMLMWPEPSRSPARDGHVPVWFGSSLYGGEKTLNNIQAVLVRTAADVATEIRQRQEGNLIWSDQSSIWFVCTPTAQLYLGCLLYTYSNLNLQLRIVGNVPKTQIDIEVVLHVKLYKYLPAQILTTHIT